MHWLKIGSLLVSGILLFIFIVGSFFEIRRYLRKLKKDEAGARSSGENPPTTFRGGK